MAAQDNVKHIEDCSVSNALGTWVFSVAGALLAIPVGIKRKSLAPLVFFGTTGTMVDIIMGISACEREHAERQLKILQEQEQNSLVVPSDDAIRSHITSSKNLYKGSVVFWILDSLLVFLL